MVNYIAINYVLVLKGKNQPLTFLTKKEPVVFSNTKISINDYEFLALVAELTDCYNSVYELNEVFTRYQSTS